MKDDLDGFEKYEDSAWFVAIRAADTWCDATRKPPEPKKSGDMSKLVDLLICKLVDARDVTLAREECELLIDLLSRHRLKQKAGGRKVPAYKRSWAEVKLEIADEAVRYYQSKGVPLEDAVERVAGRESYVPREALRLRRQGRLHHDRLRPAKTKNK